MKNINIKLLSLQDKIKPIKKDSTNPFFNSAYFDINKLIDVLKPILSELKLSIIQPVIFLEGHNVLQTIITDTESGDSITSSISLPDNLEPQKMGSAITYLRRYSLQSLLFLQAEAEDDDGSTSSPRNITKSQNTRATSTIQNPKCDVPFK